jgi:hypothetical protein
VAERGGARARRAGPVPGGRRLAERSRRACPAALLRRIRRSRTLRWLVRGIPAGPTDVAALLEERLAAIEAPLREPQHGHHAAERLGELLVGAELAAARLIVAAVDPDGRHVGAGHG